jgi:hypothetical protein
VPRSLKTFVLVNLRRRIVDVTLGNKFGIVFLELPVDKESLYMRLELVKHGMDNLKISGEYTATYFLLHLLGIFPNWIQKIATRFLDTKGTMVSSYVPGPRRQIHLAGVPIESLFAWAPQSGRIGVGLSFVTYENQLIVGLSADAGILPEPKQFMALFMAEYRELVESLPVPLGELVIQSDVVERPVLALTLDVRD